MALEFVVSDDEAGDRLDRFVAARTETPRNRVQKAIASGGVTVDGVVVSTSSAKVSSHQVVHYQALVAAEDAGPIPPSDGPLDVLHEAEHFLVLNKPAGLVVHPGAGTQDDTLANRLVYHYPEVEQVGSASRPGIVHRLDRETSGVMLAARTAEGYQHLSHAFSKRLVRKFYVALVWGVFESDQGVIEEPIGRDSTNRRLMKVSPRGRDATTRYRVVGAHPPVSALAVNLLTGRTHQIRVHFKHAGHPLLGDQLYGEAREANLPGAERARFARLERAQLHAWRLAFVDPVDASLGHQFQVPPANDLCTFWRDLSGRDLAADLAAAEHQVVSQRALRQP